ncbi:hypothetical protein CGCF415_v012562 [Colletotrichum fructicola]|uniref:Uncharacterized protein n=1 Tax=Colletotrichum fructicola (strain Nara gc5) TaxID=1213859 RepID=L2G556_COLFN|nr:uncharacterized protein CGMCC3_g5419 [Colletotrichum fructicola]KAF4480602.1 hypothetical protein CGGC5_v011553 [Colletotrichum fructicola Nara gc5]KAI8278651.1 hypothetical protein K4K60_006162 [Colletotrichum sp. SAR11_57]KAE9578273.1 hypothetical protein CGMCC3_g5419 [Colletotrichum fructicola]KAF4426421.1 hypothetical protein CFRS1_v009765 [Colletotrichum fructicola]KAF4886991.1 hypothetical protein CGCFRS4_v010823 [Colletotrichum fructicola]
MREHVGSVVPHLATGLTSYQDMPPPNHNSLSHPHRVQHYDSQPWKNIEPQAIFAWNSPHPLAPQTGTEPRMQVRLCVKTTDLKRLMREGFFWATENFNFKATYTHTFDPRKEPKQLAQMGWTCARNFFLSDLEDDPFWTAKMSVYARDRVTLDSFAVTGLSRKNMSGARAWAKDGTSGYVEDLYKWVCGSPESSYNKIYGNLPLDGWWPWPKADDDEMLHLEAMPYELGPSP